MSKDLSIETARKPLLVEGAEYFGVELEEDAKVDEIREAFKEDGIEDDAWAEFVNLREKALEKAEQKADEPEEDKGEQLLIKMNRRNPSMTIRGHLFTTRHPFQLVPVKDAEFIVSHYHGFSIALPSEAEKYYE